MENLSRDLASILQYLLPGFLAAWVFYSFTSYPKPAQFERLIQALIFTLIIQLMTMAEMKGLLWLGSYWSFGTWTDNSQLVASVVSAILLGLLFSICANTDCFHSLIRKTGITSETSFASEWFGTFKNNVTYVVIHLKDERRLFGWPREWPSDPKKGHFVIEQASWISTDGNETDLKSVDSILIGVDEVHWVEFMNKNTWKDRNGTKNTEPTSS